MDKKVLLQKIMERLVAEAEMYLRAAKFAHAEATHEQSKADNKYDTRGLEASYLARGQSRQAAEVEASIAAFEKLAPTNFGKDDAIDVGAVVRLGTKTGPSDDFFIGPRAGGIEIEMDGVEITILTPSSPLGQQIVGKREGDKVKSPADGGELLILKVS